MLDNSCDKLSLEPHQHQLWLGNSFVSIRLFKTSAEIYTWTTPDIRWNWLPICRHPTLMLRDLLGFFRHPVDRGRNGPVIPISPRASSTLTRKVNTCRHQFLHQSILHSLCSERPTKKSLTLDSASQLIVLSSDPSSDREKHPILVQSNGTHNPLCSSYNHDVPASCDPRNEPSEGAL